MKLHEAIAIGLQKTKPYKGEYSNVINGVHHASTLGAAFYSGYEILNAHDKHIPEGLKLSLTFPILDEQLETLSPPPVKLWRNKGSQCREDLWDAITEMNDYSDLSREEINQWIKEVEEKYEERKGINYEQYA